MEEETGEEFHLLKENQIEDELEGVIEICL